MSEDKSIYFGDVFANRNSVWLELEADTQLPRTQYTLDIENRVFFSYFSPSAGGLLYSFDKSCRVFGLLSPGRISEIDFIETFEDYWTEIAIINQHHINLSRKPRDNTVILAGRLEISQFLCHFIADTKFLKVLADIELHQWCENEIPADGQDFETEFLKYDDAVIYGSISEDENAIAMLGLSIEVCKLNYRLGDSGVLPQGQADRSAR